MKTRLGEVDTTRQSTSRAQSESNALSSVNGTKAEWYRLIDGNISCYLTAIGRS